MFNKPTLADAKRHLNLDHDLDNDLLAAKIEAAHGYVTAFVDVAPAGVIHEATLRLVAHLYEAREGVAFDSATLPAGIMELVAPFRAWSF